MRTRDLVTTLFIPDTAISDTLSLSDVNIICRTTRTVDGDKFYYFLQSDRDRSCLSG